MNLLQKRRIVFAFGISTCALANALLFKAKLASTAFGIAAMNISDAFNITTGIALFIINCLFFVICRVVEKKKPTLRNFIGLFGSLLLGFYIDFFSNLISVLPVSPALNLFYMTSGVVLLAFSISTNIKASYIVFPLDESIKIISYRFFKGNLAKGGYIVYSFALIVALILGVFISHNLLGFSIYSVVIFFALSPLLEFFARSTKQINRFLEIA